MRKKLVGATLAFAAAFGGMIAVAPTADAATSCRTSSRNFDLPHMADEKVTIKLCIVSYSGGIYKATATVSAYSWDPAPWDDPRFDAFELDLRVERHDYIMNRTKQELGWVSYPNQTRTVEVWYRSTAKGGYSADAAVLYDINNDGKGYSKWDLYGSPVIS
ncbi:hypothetical protein [Embleya sp. NPDC001921]